MNHATKITVNGVPWGPDPKHVPCSCRRRRPGDFLFWLVLATSILSAGILVVRTCTQDQGSHVRGTTSEAAP